MNGNKVIEFPGLNTTPEAQEQKAETLSAIRASDRTNLQSARWENRASTGRVRFSPTQETPSGIRLNANQSRDKEAMDFLKLLSEISG